MSVWASAVDIWCPVVTKGPPVLVSRNWFRPQTCGSNHSPQIFHRFQPVHRIQGVTRDLNSFWPFWCLVCNPSLILLAHSQEGPLQWLHWSPWFTSSYSWPLHRHPFRMSHSKQNIQIVSERKVETERQTHLNKCAKHNKETKTMLQPPPTNHPNWPVPCNVSKSQRHLKCLRENPESDFLKALMIM